MVHDRAQERGDFLRLGGIEKLVAPPSETPADRVAFTPLTLSV